MKCICSLIFLQNFNFIDIKCKSVLDILKWSSLVTVFTVVTCNYHLTPDTEDVAWLVSAVYWHSLEATHCPRLGRSDSGCEETPLPAQLATLHWDMRHDSILSSQCYHSTWSLATAINGQLCSKLLFRTNVTTWFEKEDEGRLYYNLRNVVCCLCSFKDYQLIRLFWLSNDNNKKQNK